MAAAAGLGHVRSMSSLVKAPCEEALIRATPCAHARLSPRRGRLVLAATVLGSSLAFIDGSAVNVTLPTIQRGLGADAATAQWVINAYLLGLGSFVLLGGSAGDRFGRRRVFMVGVALFTLASIACGLSVSASMLVASRALQGVGAALLTPTSMAILGASFDDDARGAAIGVWAGVGALMSAAGPVLGGWLADAVSWQAVFWINVPLAAGAISLAAVAVPESRDPAAKQLDWAGAGLAAAGLLAFTWGLTVLPQRSASDSWALGALGGGALLLLGFVALETRVRQPMMPLGLFRSAVFSGVNVVTVLLYFALGGALFFLPFALIRLRGYTAAQAGLSLLPFSLVMGLGSALSGRLADRVGARPLLIGGPILAGLGFAFFAWSGLAAGYWSGVFPGVLSLAVGMTLTVAPLTATVISAVPPERVGVASGINTAAARVAGLLAVATLGVVFFAAFRRALPGVPEALVRADMNALMAGRAPASPDAAPAFESAIRGVMLVAGACAVTAGLVSAIFLPRAAPPGRR